MLGPMVNPAAPQKQIIGVYDLELARRYHYIYQHLDRQYVILHSLDGYDEISLTNDFKIMNNRGELLVSPGELGYERIKPEEITGGKDVAESAVVFKNILEGKGTKAQNQVVIANAAYALSCYYPDKEISYCLDMAATSLKDGKALGTFKKLVG